MAGDTIGAEFARFWAKVDKNGPIPDACPELGPCWEWTDGRHSRGYGVFHLPGRKQVLAHRFALILAEGRPGTDSPHALHRCDNPPCCNPSHLHWGTHAQNMSEAADRGLAKAGRSNLDRCPIGHSMDNPLMGIRRHPRTGKVYTTRSCRECNRAYLARRRASKKENAA